MSKDNREILFRGKPKKKHDQLMFGGFVYGDYITGLNGLLYIRHFVKHNGGKSTSAVQTEVIPETVGQYTGLKDKRDSKIYEGDILQSISSKNTPIQHSVLWLDRQAGYVAQFIPFNEINPNCTLIQSWVKDYGKRVVGNIHDNPKQLTN